MYVCMYVCMYIYIYIYNMAVRPRLGALLPAPVRPAVGWTSRFIKGGYSGNRV